MTITGPGIDPIDLLDVGFHDAGSLPTATRLWANNDPEYAIDQPTGDLGPAYTVSWVNSGPPGDPLEERTVHQLIYLDAEGGPVIHNPDQLGLEGWGGEVIGWFRAPEDLGDILHGLGVPLLVGDPSGGSTSAWPYPVGIALVGMALAAVGWLVARHDPRLQRLESS